MAQEIAPKKFKNDVDQTQFSVYYVSILNCIPALPKDIATELAYCSTGDIYDCSCKKCPETVCFLQEDWQNHLIHIENEQWKIISGFYYCIKCVEEGPVVLFDCCNAKCMHGDKKKKCLFSNDNRFFCENGDNYCLAFYCDECGPKPGALFCCGKYICPIHSNHVNNIFNV